MPPAGKRLRRRIAQLEANNPNFTFPLLSRLRRQLEDLLGLTPPQQPPPPGQEPPANGEEPPSDGTDVGNGDPLASFRNVTYKNNADPSRSKDLVVDGTVKAQEATAAPNEDYNFFPVGIAWCGEGEEVLRLEYVRNGTVVLTTGVDMAPPSEVQGECDTDPRVPSAGAQGVTEGGDDWFLRVWPDGNPQAGMELPVTIQRVPASQVFNPVLWNIEFQNATRGTATTIMQDGEQVTDSHTVPNAEDEFQYAYQVKNTGAEPGDPTVEIHQEALRVHEDENIGPLDPGEVSEVRGMAPTPLRSAGHNASEHFLKVEGFTSQGTIVDDTITLDIFAESL